MKLYIVLAEINEEYATALAVAEVRGKRFLDARVESALDFRGTVLDSRLIEGGDGCRIHKNPLTGRG